MSLVLSVNVGAPEHLRHAKGIPTGICKVPVNLLEVRDPGPRHGGRGSGVVGDFIGDREHHGGASQAVYAVAREQLDWWAEQLGRDLPDGMFGENLTTSGVEVDRAIIGERWRVGDEVELRVCGPRIPCETFSARMGEPRWLKRFTAHGLTGAYLAVVTPGMIRRGDPVAVIDRPEHGVDVSTSFRAFVGDLDAADRVLAAGCLGAEDHAELADSVLRRRRAPRSPCSVASSGREQD